MVEQLPFGQFGHPDIPAIHWVDHLEPYIERKLFSVNTSHSTAAYYGKNAGKKYIAEAIKDDYIRSTVRDVLQETASLMVEKYAITAPEQQEYVEMIISRISNPYLEDSVERVGRSPIRKMGRKERFIGPAAQLAERKMKCDSLLGSMEMALRFQNVEGDAESAELAKILKENSPGDATIQLTGLERDHPLFCAVVKTVELVQSETK